MRRFLLVLISIVAVGLTPGASDATATLTVGSATVNVGALFTIPVSVSGVTDLQAFQFDLTYDLAILSVLSFTDVGTDFDTAATAGGGFLTGITGFDLGGLLSGVADSMSGVPPGLGLTVSGVVTNIQFQALLPGVSPLTLSNAFLNLASSGFDVVDGQVTVNTPVSPVPEPSTLALLSLGLGAEGLRRWARSPRR